MPPDTPNPQARSPGVENSQTGEVGRVCRRNPVWIVPGEDIAEAARRMRTAHIGFLVVCETVPRQRVVGVLTDRDIVITVVARDADPRSLKVEDVMTRNPLMVAENCTLTAALDFMQAAGVRRVPVVGAQNELVGVLSLDDVVENLARQLTSIAAAFRGERRVEKVARP